MSRRYFENNLLLTYGAGRNLTAKLHFCNDGRIMVCKWCKNPVLKYTGITRLIRDIPTPTFKCIICSKETYEGQETRGCKKDKVYY